MHLIDHNELNPPIMLCPFRSKPDGTPVTCMGEACALWYQPADPDYSGCSAYITAFYARDIAYHTHNRGYHRRE